jgi:hypothetical protein
MRQSFIWHGGIAATLGTSLLLLTALTWLPGSLPRVDLQLTRLVLMVLVLLTVGAALVRQILAGGGRQAAYTAFRCLPRTWQATLAALAVFGVFQVAFSWTAMGDWHAPEAGGGRYYAFHSPQRDTIEISRDQYLTTFENEQRFWCAGAGLLLIVGAGIALTAGELRRADQPQPGR